ncbi:MAG: histone H1 [Bacteroidales bacterium]|nr:histone H1 [Bacteroidales bacterium]
MEKLIKDIKAQLAAISADIDKVENKAAKARVRKATLALEKLGKEYRKVSVK